MQGGLQTHLHRAEDFWLNDEYTIAFYHFWSADAPFVKNLQDAQNIVIPEKEFYEDGSERYGSSGSPCGFYIVGPNHTQAVREKLSGEES